MEGKTKKSNVRSHTFQSDEQFISLTGVRCLYLIHHSKKSLSRENHAPFNSLSFINIIIRYVRLHVSVEATHHPYNIISTCGISKKMVGNSTSKPLKCSLKQLS